MQHLTGLTADLLSLLLLTYVTTALSVLVPNWMQQISHPRPHNGERVWEDLLARLHLANVGYLMTVTVVADLSPVYLRVLYTFMILLIGFWLGCLKLCFDQDRRLLADTAPMPWPRKLAFLRIALTLALIGCLIATFVSLNPMKRRHPSPDRPLSASSPRT